MAITRYHNIVGSSAVTTELIAPFEDISNIKSIVITNTHATADGTITLFIQKSTTSSTTTFKITNILKLPAGVSLLLDDKMFSITTDFGLYITVGSSDTMDVLINL